MFRSRSFRRAALVALAVLLAAPALAQAVHWPFYGGDAGRSGFQPVDEGTLPAPLVYEKTEATEQFIRNSIVTTAGGNETVQRFAYGTEDPAAAGVDGRVHLQRLSDGVAVGPEGGTLVDDNANDADTFSGEETFRGLNSAGVSFADASTANALGVLYVVHNDDNQDGTNDIAITRIDESTGLPFGGADYAVPNTDGFTISSSPVLSGLRAAGENNTPPAQRDLYFVARRPAVPDTDPIGDNSEPEQVRLFKITIDDPGTIDAAFGAVDSELVPGGNPLASPALGTFAGTPLVLASSNSANTLQSFTQDTLTPGPASGDLGDDGQTPSVPVGSNGLPPAEGGSVFLAVGQGGSNQSTRAYRLVLDTAADPDAFDDVDQSELLAGQPAPALSVAREAAPNTTADDRVVVTTGRNLYSLFADDLTRGSRLSFADGRTAGGDGFSRTTAATTGNLGAVTTDDGQQIVFGLDDAQPVATGAGGFTESPNNAAAISSYGQPSISRRFIQFGTDRGAFVYRASRPTYSIGDAEVVEGDTGTRLVFTVTLSQAAAETVTVGYATADGTATDADNDYEPTSGTLTFAPGDTSETITVPVNGDTDDESDETFVVNLSGATNATPATAGDDQATGTIRDDDSPTETRPSVSIGDASAAEGDTGTTTLTFPVTLSRPSAAPIDVDYATANGTATAGSDYVAETGTVTFAPQDTSEAITITVNGDLTVEQTEQFVVNLTLAAGEADAVLADNQGTGSIVNDDVTPNEPNDPSVSVGDASVDEGDSGTRDATLTVALSGPADGAVSVDYATAAGTATAGSDYATTSGTVTFADGEQSKTITVAVSGDGVDEGNERFTVNLSNAAGASIADAQGVGTINDDDRAVLTIGDVAADEGTGTPKTFILTVTLSRPASRAITTRFATANGTAVAGQDFTTTAGTLTFDPGQTTKVIGVPVTPDAVDEPNEAFTVSLADATAPVSGATAGAIIADDDNPAATRPPVTPRVAPTSLTTRVTPGRDPRAPFAFRTTGRIGLPAGVTRARGCLGRVSVQIKRGANTISTRRTNVRRDCTFASTVVFSDRRRLPRRGGTLKVTARFLGNPALLRFNGRPVTVRFGPRR